MADTTTGASAENLHLSQAPTMGSSEMQTTGQQRASIPGPIPGVQLPAHPSLAQSQIF